MMSQVRSTKNNQPFLAIVLASNRPIRLQEFFNNLLTTADDPTSFEILICVDEDDDVTIQIVKEFQDKAPFRIYALIEYNPYGTYCLYKGYDKLIKKHMSESVYFVCNLTDEIRIQTQGWDSVLKKYIKFYDDDIFRLEFSDNKLRNYRYLTDCLYTPDNYPVITKKWLQVVGGWGEFWGTDSWQQSIDYYLGQCYVHRIPWGIFRSVPIYDLIIKGQEAGIGMKQDRKQKHDQMVANAFSILQSAEGLENFARLATRLRAYIHAKEKGLTQFALKEDLQLKTISIFNADQEQIGKFSFGIAEFKKIPIPLVMKIKIMAYNILSKSFGHNLALKIGRIGKRLIKTIGGIYILRLIQFFLNIIEKVKTKYSGKFFDKKIINWFFKMHDNHDFFASGDNLVRKKMEELYKQNKRVDFVETNS